MSFCKTKCLENERNEIFMKKKLSLFDTIGRMNRSNFGGFRVKPSPTKHGFVTKRFQAFSTRIQSKVKEYNSSSSSPLLFRFPD